MRKAKTDSDKYICENCKVEFNVCNSMKNIFLNHICFKFWKESNFDRHIKLVHPSIQAPKITNYCDVQTSSRTKRMNLFLQLLLNGKPFNLFDDPAFIQLTMTENRNLDINLSSKLIREHLYSTFLNMNSKLTDIIKGKFLCLKFDCASRS